MTPGGNGDGTTWQAWFTFSVVLVSLILMASELAQPDMAMVAALVTFVVAGIVTVPEATAGFAQPGLLTVMVLFAVTAGLERTGALEPIRRAILSRGAVDRTPVHELLLRFVPAVVATSAFLNNTPIVGILISVVTELAARAQLPPSKLLIPLSYAAVLGGTCTLVGTSTNLVVASLAEQATTRELGEPLLVGFFEIGAVGLPTALVGVLFLLLTAGPLLPVRQPDDATARARKRGGGRPREYAVVVFVPPGSDFIGKCMPDTELSSMPGIRVYRRIRGDEIVEDPSPCGCDALREGDVLCLSGIANAVIDLLRVRGLRFVEHHHRRSLLHTALAAKAGVVLAASPRLQPPPPPFQGPASPGGMPSPVSLPRSALGDRSGIADGAGTGFGFGFGFGRLRSDASLSSAGSEWAGGASAAATAIAGAAHSTQSWLRRLLLVDETRLAEVVIGATGDLAGRTVAELRFFERYGAAILAVLRRGDGTTTVLNMGKLRLRAGDGLLLACPPTFVEAHRDDSAFALVADVEHYSPARSSRAAVAVALTVAMVASAAALRGAGVALFTAALVCAGAMLAAGCLSVEDARKAFRLDIFLVIGAAFGVSTAMANSGAASLVANLLLMGPAAGAAAGTGVSLAPVVIVLYATTAVLTELITNNAAVAIMFPVLFQAHMAAPAALPLRPLVHTLMMAGSASFITPTGYQTNLMVYGPGGYRYLDFPRIGIPMQLLAMGTTCTVVLNPGWWWALATAAAAATVAWVAAMRVCPLAPYAPGRFRDVPTEIAVAAVPTRASVTRADVEAASAEATGVGTISAALEGSQLMDHA